MACFIGPDNKQYGLRKSQCYPHGFELYEVDTDAVLERFLASHNYTKCLNLANKFLTNNCYPEQGVWIIGFDGDLRMGKLKVSGWKEDRNVYLKDMETGAAIQRFNRDFMEDSLIIDHISRYAAGHPTKRRA